MISDNTQVKILNKTISIRCCSNCQFYQHEEIGDSDFGTIYADMAICSKHYDTKENIPNFDRNIERKCCVLDFFKVCEIDNELNESFNKELNKGDSFNKTYKRFCEKYK